MSQSDNLKTYNDLEYLKDTYGRDLLEELVSILKTQKEEIVSEWRTRQDLTELDLTHGSHKIKSSSRNVGAHELGEIFQAVESNPNLVFAKQQVENIEVVFKQYMTCFQNWKDRRE